MSGNQLNFTFLWVTLAFVLLPALVHCVPLKAVEQQVVKLDSSEEIVPEEPLPLQIIEDLEALEAKEVVAVDEEHPTLDQTDVEENEPINKADELSIQEKPLIKLLSQDPSEVTYDVIDSESITPLSAAVKAIKYSAYVTDYDPLNDETSLPIQNLDKPSESSTTLVPVLEELKITSDKEKSTSHKKEALLKILDKIVSQVLIEEVLSTTLAAHHVEELEEISPSEEKVLLQRVIKGLDRYLETGAIELAKVENVPPLEESTSSSVQQVSTKSMVRQYFIPRSSNHDLEKYFLKPNSKSVPRIG